MRILHTISSFRTGGAEKLLIDTVREHYYSKGEKSNVCIINNEYDEYMVSELRKFSDIYFLGKEENQKSIKYIYKFIKLLKDLQIDILHCHNRGSCKFSIISKIVLKKIKIIYTMHGTNIYNNISNIYVKLDKKFINKFIAISNAVQSELLERGIKDENISLIHNGINIESYNLKKHNCNNEIIIGCVARLVPEIKGQDILIKALYEVKKLYPNIKCKLAGDVPIENGIKKIENRVKLQELTKKLELEGHIEFLGNIENIPKFLQSINIFVLPSRYEGFGLSIIEAISSKTPVIASNIDGPKEILKEGKYGLLFETENEIDLSKKIISLIESDENKTIDTAYEYVNGNYSIKNMYEKYFNVYEEVFCG